MNSSGSAYSTARASSFVARCCKTLPLLVGIGLFVVTVLWSFAQNASLAPQASRLAFQEPECVQPAEGGCPITFDAPVSAVLDDNSVIHLWLLFVPEGTSFEVWLYDIATVYELVLWAPDDSLLASATNEDSSEVVLALEGAAEGQYSITVASPAGDLAGDPYTLLAVLVALAEPEPVAPTPVPTATPAPTATPSVREPYAVPPRTTALPYRLISPAPGGG